jgi:hypothetical protein
MYRFPLRYHNVEQKTSQMLLNLWCTPDVLILKLAVFAEKWLINTVRNKIW